MRNFRKYYFAKERGGICTPTSCLARYDEGSGLDIFIYQGKYIAHMLLSKGEIIYIHSKWYVCNCDRYAQYSIGLNISKFTSNTIHVDIRPSLYGIPNEYDYILRMARGITKRIPIF